jgi:hypothetical protein
VKVAQFATPIAKLQDALDKLQHAWQDTEQHWDDATSDNLGEAHLEPIFKQLKEIIESTVPLSEGMGQMARACAPQSRSEM